MTAVRDPQTGRYRPIRTDWPTCPACGSVLHQRLSGEDVCLTEWCARRRLVVGVSDAVR